MSCKYENKNSCHNSCRSSAFIVNEKLWNFNVEQVNYAADIIKLWKFSIKTEWGKFLSVNVFN